MELGHGLGLGLQVLHLFNDLIDFSLWVSRWLLCLWIRLLKAIENDLDPPAKMLVLSLMELHDLVGLEYLVLLDLDHLMDECLDNPDAHLIIG